MATQLDLQGRTIDDMDAAIARCLEYRERKSSLKIIYPGYYFNISISAKEDEELDNISEDAKRGAYVVAKMKRAKPKERLPKGEEGRVYQFDFNLFIKMLWPTGTEHISPETYQALMAERKPQEISDEATPSKRTKELKAVAKGVVEKLKEHFGEGNVKGTLYPEGEE